MAEASPQITGERLQGRVISWNNGWGFLRPSGWKKDLFCHYSQIQSDEHYKQLSIGDIVEFEVGEHNGKPQANNVIVVDSGR